MRQLPQGNPGQMLRFRWPTKSMMSECSKANSRRYWTALALAAFVKCRGVCYRDGPSYRPIPAWRWPSSVSMPPPDAPQLNPLGTSPAIESLPAVTSRVTVTAERSVSPRANFVASTRTSDPSQPRTTISPSPPWTTTQSTESPETENCSVTVRRSVSVEPRQSAKPHTTPNPISPRTRRRSVFVDRVSDAPSKVVSLDCLVYSSVGPDK